MASALPIERFERILETMTNSEMTRLLTLMEQNLSEKEILHLLVSDFDLESKGFNAHGYSFKEPLPMDWNWIMPSLKTSHDIYKHFPVITDRIKEMKDEAYSIQWHNKKYEARFEKSNELPEDFHTMMTDRLLNSLKAAGNWIIKPARHELEICHIICLNNVTNDDRNLSVSDCESLKLVAVPAPMDLALAALATLKNTIPLIYNKTSSNTITVDVYIKELLARKDNIDKVRAELESKLMKHSIWTVNSINCEQYETIKKHKGFQLTLL